MQQLEIRDKIKKETSYIKTLGRQFNLMKLLSQLRSIMDNIYCPNYDRQRNLTQGDLLQLIECNLHRIMTDSRCENRRAVYVTNSPKLNILILLDDYHYLRFLRHLRAIVRKLKKMVLVQQYQGYLPCCMSTRLQVHARNFYPKMIVRANTMNKTIKGSKQHA